MLNMSLRSCENTNMSDVKKLIDLFNSYTSPCENTKLTPPPSNLKLSRRRSSAPTSSARLCDISRNSSTEDWNSADFQKRRIGGIELISSMPKSASLSEPERQHNFATSTPRSCIDRSSTVRASVIKSIVTRKNAKELVRPATAYASTNGNHLMSSYENHQNDRNEISPVSSPWEGHDVEIMETTPSNPDFVDDLPPKPKWMESIERLSCVQPAVRQNWNVVNGQLRAKLRAADLDERP